MPIIVLKDNILRNKIIISITVSTLLLLLAGFSFFLISKDAMLIQNPVIIQQNAVVTYAIGECLYKENEQTDWILLEIGQKIKVGYILKTLDDGEIDIRFSDNTLMKMDYNTIMTIDENTLKDLSVNLNEGRLFAKFHKLFNDQKFRVQSKDAVAGIRGTDLVFESFPDKTEIYALSGITEIYNQKFENDKILLAFQKKTTVRKDSIPTQPADMTKAEIKEYQQTLNLIHPEKVFLISNNIQFQANTAKILPSSFSELEIVLNAMKQKSFRIEIAGHTANVGSSSAMFDLSILRAQAIKDYLVEEGISERRLKIKGYGGSTPISDNNTEKGRALNRRVEFIILDN